MNNPTLPARPLRLGVLDFGHRPLGKDARQALLETVALAKKADALGYTRYWLGEHHAADSAWAAPELLIPVLAGHTRTLRLGTACVLLHYYSALKVAENFRLLECLFPGRIDLGVGGGKVRADIADALLDGQTTPLDKDAYARKIRHLIAHLDDDFPKGHPRARVRTTPVEGGQPELWLLGSGRDNASLAALHGTAFSYALFLHTSQLEPTIVEAYQTTFQPGRHQATPKFNIAVAGFCAETEAHAQHLAQTFQSDFLRPNVVGTPAQCREQLATICERFGTDECMFLDLSTRFEDRVRSYELLAETFDLMYAVAR